MKNLYSQRQQRVAVLINNVLAYILQSQMILKDYSSSCPITITKVTVTPDLKIAHCYYVPFNTKMAIDQIQKLLDSSIFAIRKELTDKINLKYSPTIKFFYDQGFANSDQVENILKKLKHYGTPSDET